MHNLIEIISKKNNNNIIHITNIYAYNNNILQGNLFNIYNAFKTLFKNIIYIENNKYISNLLATGGFIRTVNIEQRIFENAKIIYSKGFNKNIGILMIDDPDINSNVLSYFFFYNLI